MRHVLLNFKKPAKPPGDVDYTKTPCLDRPGTRFPAREWSYLEVRPNPVQTQPVRDPLSVVSCWAELFFTPPNRKRQITDLWTIAFEPELDVPRDNSTPEQGSEPQAGLHVGFCAIDVARWLGGLFEVQKRVPRTDRPRHPTDPPPKPLKLLRVLSGISKGQVPTPKGHFAIQFGSHDPGLRPLRGSAILIKCQRTWGADGDGTGPWLRTATACGQLPARRRLRGRSGFCS